MSHPFRYIIQSWPWYTIKLATRFSLYVFDNSLTVYVKMKFLFFFFLCLKCYLTYFTFTIRMYCVVWIRLLLWVIHFPVRLVMF